MSLIPTIDRDGDTPLGTIRMNADGLSIRDSSDNWITIDYTFINEHERFISNLTTANEYRQSVNADWIDQSRLSSRRYDIFNNDRRPSYSPQDLVMADIKVENMGDYKFKTIITYIDTKNYQEVKQEYMSSITMTQNFTISGNDNLEIKIEQTGEIQETRKDI